MRGESIEDKVKKFQNAFGQSTNETYPSNHACSPTKTLRRTLIDEEYMELKDAIKNGTDEEVLKEICDLVYVAVGYATTYGWNFDCAFNRTHISNLSKLGDDGKPVYREDGKVSKSSNYKTPKMVDLV